MIKIQIFENTEPILDELRSQIFISEKNGHPEVFFPNKKNSPLMFSFFESIAKDLKRNLVFLQANRFKKNDSAPWHNDLEQDTDYIAMLYLTKDIYDSHEKGCLEIGWGYNSEVRSIARICPNAGTLVTLDNTQENLLHSVPSTCDKERYSVLGFFGTGSSLF